ncbi:pentapeptide repeat-containing protein, partial [Nocardia sp. NPDC058497]|uniref:pentapeptide repeat-containing protein n=1 Tax=Nocardia sp. NPDC058497 TaxID=3346529 RepID=UPI00365F2DD2
AVARLARVRLTRVRLTRVRLTRVRLTRVRLTRVRLTRRRLRRGHRDGLRNRRWSRDHRANELEPLQILRENTESSDVVLPEQITVRRHAVPERCSVHQSDIE